MPQYTKYQLEDNDIKEAIRLLGYKLAKEPQTDGSAYEISLAEGGLGRALAYISCAKALFGYSDYNYFIELAKLEIIKVASFFKDKGWENPGLFDGMAGYLFVVSEYQRITENSSGSLIKMTNAFYNEVRDTSKLLEGTDENIHPVQYDLITGLAGSFITVNRIFSAHGITVPRFPPILLDLMLELEDQVPQDSRLFCTDHEYSPDLTANYPEGYLNLGTAHGWFGLLLAAIHFDLSKKTKNDLLKKAQRYISSYGDAPVLDPTFKIDKRNTNMSWCYGIPTRILTAENLEINIKKSENEFSEINFSNQLDDEGVLRAFYKLRKHRNFGLCHGVSGLAANITALQKIDPKKFIYSSNTIFHTIISDIHNEEIKINNFRDVKECSYASQTGYLNGVSGVIVLLEGLITKDNGGLFPLYGDLI